MPLPEKSPNILRTMGEGGEPETPALTLLSGYRESLAVLDARGIVLLSGVAVPHVENTLLISTEPGDRLLVLGTVVTPEGVFETRTPVVDVGGELQVVTVGEVVETFTNADGEQEEVPQQSSEEVQTNDIALGVAAGDSGLSLSGVVVAGAPLESTDSPTGGSESFFETIFDPETGGSVNIIIHSDGSGGTERL